MIPVLNRLLSGNAKKRKRKKNLFNFISMTLADAYRAARAVPVHSVCAVLGFTEQKQSTKMLQWCRPTKLTNKPWPKKLNRDAVEILYNLGDGIISCSVFNFIYSDLSFFLLLLLKRTFCSCYAFMLHVQNGGEMKENGDEEFFFSFFFFFK